MRQRCTFCTPINVFVAMACADVFVCRVGVVVFDIAVVFVFVSSVCLGVGFRATKRNN